MRRALWVNGHFWDSPIKIGAHHYARLLAESGWEVAFCSDPISPFHFAKWSTIRETRDRLRVWRSGGCRDMDGRLFYYTPFTLCPHYDAPLLRSRWVLDNWHRLTFPDVLRHLEARGFADPDLLVIDSMIQSFWLDVIRPRKTLLRISDDLSGFRGVTQAMLQRERELIGRVDLVAYTAKKLEAKILPFNPRATLHVPNGVDLAHFLNAPVAPPAEYSTIPAPRALYVGALDDWFDVGLVATAARALPHVSFVIIGPERTDLRLLKDHANVHILGRRPYALVPQYMKHAQVGLIPFHVTEMIRSVHPIKLYEYMACGLPVVAVSWDELETLGSPAWLCDGPDAFIAAIPQALETDAAARHALAAYATGADWRNRFALITRALEI